MRWLRRRRLDRLLKPVLPGLRRFCRRLCRDADEAEDLLQEAVLAALGRFGKLRHEGAFKVWMHRIVYTVHLDRRDREARHRRRVDAYAQVVALPGATVDPAEARWLGRALATALDALPDLQREAVWLVDVEGLSFTETAEVLGCKRGTVASRVARARAALRQDLAQVAHEVGVLS
ncbi:MAG: sigma-70 family RNA polymerase sigma factor [Myxococcales bacterium]|nr:sigma-70 family RNA polymerase sigma factor [Myxococcales bacterium]